MECTRSWPMKLTTLESAGRLTTARSPKVWKPRQEGDGVHLGYSDEHRKEDGNGVVTSDALEAWQDVQSLRDSDLFFLGSELPSPESLK